jgi:ubiquinone/menaquinone biosynthesis C-methylase UbiE
MSEITPAQLALVLDEASLWAARFGVLLFEHVPLARHLDILDVGCGTGFPLFEMAGVFGKSCRLTGLDIWSEAIEQARKKNEIYGWDNVSLVHGDAARLPFGDACFDLVVSNLGINNWDEPLSVVRECARVLRPGGRLALTTNPSGMYREFYDALREVLEDTGDGEALARLRAAVAHRGTRDSIAELLQSGGLELTRMLEDRFTMRFADGAALFTHILTRIGFLDGWRAIVTGLDEKAVFDKVIERLDGGGRPVELTVPMLYVEAAVPRGTSAAE